MTGFSVSVSKISLRVVNSKFLFCLFNLVQICNLVPKAKIHKLEFQLTKHPRELAILIMQLHQKLNSIQLLKSKRDEIVKLRKA